MTRLKPEHQLPKSLKKQYRNNTCIWVFIAKPLLKCKNSWPSIVKTVLPLGETPGGSLGEDRATSKGCLQGVVSDGHLSIQ